MTEIEYCSYNKKWKVASAKMKEAMNLVLDQDLVAEVPDRYDVFAIFTVGKKYNTTFSTFDLYLTLKMNFVNCSFRT